jgi:hypothetical protein
MPKRRRASRSRLIGGTRTTDMMKGHSVSKEQGKGCGDDGGDTS